MEKDFDSRALEQLDEYRWLLPRQGRKLTDGLLFLDRQLFDHVRNDKSISQVAAACKIPASRS